jgi:hypothetical protein
VSDERPIYLLRLQALPDGGPPEQRVKRLLKALLRGGYRMRCLDVREEQPGDDQDGVDRGPRREPEPGGRTTSASPERHANGYGLICGARTAAGGSALGHAPADPE